MTPGRVLEVSDRQLETIATNYAFTAFNISGLGACLYLAILQYLLIRVHLAKQKAKAPSSLELCLGITALWTFQHILDSVISFLIDTIVVILVPEGALLEYYSLRQTSYSLNSWAAAGSTSGWDGILLLSYETLATWLIYQGLVFLLDTVVPIFRDIRQGNHQYIAVKLQTRIIELVDFGKGLYQNDVSDSSFEKDQVRSDGMWEIEKRNTQVVRLKRVQIDNPDRGLRSLSWDLTVDKIALDEMKETLGPPGGFGEMGFNVAGDRICFGAIGVGTKFELTFILEPRAYKAPREERRRKSG